MLYTCSFCGVSKNSFCQYTKHLRLFHEHLPDFAVTCNIDGCSNSCKTVRCFVRHAAGKHKHPSNKKSKFCPRTVEPVQISMESDDEEGLARVENSDLLCDTFSLEQSVQAFEKHVASSVLKITEKHILPVSVKQEIVNAMQFTAAHMHDTYKGIFQAFCAEHNLSGNTGMGQLLLDDSPLLDGAFTEIDSKFKFTSAVASYFDLVKPIELVLKNSSKALMGQKPVFSYVPVSSVLRFLLSKEAVRDNILAGKKTVPAGYYTDYTDGDAFKNHMFFFSAP